MTSFFKRTLILLICRILDYAMMILSPIFLVRILDKQQYGQYREFLLYAMLFANLLGMTVKRNLLFFIPLSPSDEKDYLGGTNLLTLGCWLLTSLAILIFKPFILANTSFDFVWILIVYLFVFLNFDYLDMYWLAHKRSDYVLYYSVSRVGGRVASIIIASYVFRTVYAALYAMIIFETIKCIATFIFLNNLKLLIFRIKKRTIKPQLVYIIPLAVATAVLFLNQRISQFLVSSLMGVESLAIYTIGCTQVPIMGIVRSTVSDVIFPDMAQRNSKDPLEGLRLWKRANIVFCFIVFPIFAIFFCYAEEFIRILFTEQYLQAVPIFRIYLFLMLRQCFEMGSPLRAMNKNFHFIVGNIVALICNIGLLYILFKPFNMKGAAIAFLAADLALTFYLAATIIHVYKISLQNLFFWSSVLKISAVCIISASILYLNRFMTSLGLVAPALLSVLFLGLYTAILYRLNISEVNLLINKIIDFVNTKISGFISK